jgi:vesicle-fusing ATPase
MKVTLEVAPFAPKYQKYGYTNCVYLNKKHKFRTPYVEINGYVFEYVYKSFVPTNSIMMNNCNRVQIGVPVKASINVNDYVSELVGEIVQMMVTIKFLNIDNVNDNIYFNDELKQLFEPLNGWYLTENQDFVGTIRGSSFKMHLQTMNGNKDQGLVTIKRGQFNIKTTKIQFVSDTTLRVIIGDEDHVAFKLNQIDMTELGLGGIDSQFEEIMRTVFASRLMKPELFQKYGIRHKKGLILYGPSGTGKTKFARVIGKILNTREPKIVNGPEILDKYVGQSEANVRSLFADAEEEWEEKGIHSGLHLIIFDEIDALCRKRREIAQETNNVANNVVNQLLSMIDGINSLENILVIGLTNRFDLLDEAMLRPGRFGVHIELGLPDVTGREQIFKIHTKGLLANNMLDADIDLEDLAKKTRNYTGAEIENVVQNACSYAIMRKVNVQCLSGNTVNITSVTEKDFEQALKESKPAFGSNELSLPENLLIYNTNYAKMIAELESSIEQLKHHRYDNLMTVLLEGPRGSGKTALASHMALKSGCPFVKCLTSEKLISLSHDINKASFITQLFHDSYRSREAVIILDNIEALVNFIAIGPHYSHILINTISTLLTAQPPNSKLFIIGTTSSIEILDKLGLSRLFNNILSMPLITSFDMPELLNNLYPDLSICSPDLSVCTANFHELFTDPITIKDLLSIVNHVSLGTVTFEEACTKYMSRHKRFLALRTPRS